MYFVEYGKENTDVIVLLHGGGLSWWNYCDAAQILQKDYHVILPVLDGHAGSDRPFTSIEDNALEMIQTIDEHFGGTVLFMGGLSLGGQILLEILSQRQNICKFALVESALVYPSKLTYSMIRPAFGSCYGLIKYKWFSKLQFQSLKINPKLFDDYYRDTCAVSKSDMIAFLEANSMYSLKDTIRKAQVKLYVLVGEKENTAMQKSAKCIHSALEGSVLQVLPRLYHGEFSINYGQDYAKMIREIVKNG